jgi:hypothetical protein
MKKTYQGSCHCGGVRVEVDADVDHVRVCDCSICAKRGALNFRVSADDIRFLTPLSELTLYQWGTFTARDYFCPVCGILPFRQPRHATADELARGATGAPVWAVNVRCLAGVDAASLPVRHVQGSRLPLP